MYNLFNFCYCFHVVMQDSHTQKHLVQIVYWWTDFWFNSHNCLICYFVQLEEKKSHLITRMTWAINYTDDQVQDEQEMVVKSLDGLRPASSVQKTVLNMLCCLHWYILFLYLQMLMLLILGHWFHFLAFLLLWWNSLHRFIFGCFRTSSSTYRCS